MSEPGGGDKEQRLKNQGLIDLLESWLNETPTPAEIEAERKSLAELMVYIMDREGAYPAEAHRSVSPGTPTPNYAGTDGQFAPSHVAAPVCANSHLPHANGGTNHPPVAFVVDGKPLCDVCYTATPKCGKLNDGIPCGLPAGTKCPDCAPAEQRSSIATPPDPGTEKLLRDLLDRAYKMMLMSGYRVAVVDADNNDPIIAWMSDARHILYGSGRQPDLARVK